MSGRSADNAAVDHHTASDAYARWSAPGLADQEKQKSKADSRESMKLYIVSAAGDINKIQNLNNAKNESGGQSLDKKIINNKKLEKLLKNGTLFCNIALHNNVWQMTKE